MRSSDIRRAFQDFFVERDHTLVPSSSLIPHDATLLFTNSGMVPFKPYFVGDEPAPYPRAVSVQKCVRAGGKHNDLDEVGRTSRHLTFFEMMGNFSFGNYFKERAIPLAWEFFTEVLNLDPQRLWVTVHLTDDEAAEIWQRDVGVPPERIQRLDEDNWWRMADTGPNGPCSEIFWDKGPEYGPAGGPANPEADERYVEIWNLVFMQFDQQPDGSQVPLPRPSIDTGAGLERVSSVLQGVDSVFETDEFQRLLEVASEATAVPVGDARTDVSLRIIADHARSTTFLVNDGVFPSNEDRGYVLRRIIRRAVRHAYILGVSKPVMARMSAAVVELMGQQYPDLVENGDYIADVLAREEESFRQTLASGSALLDGELDRLDAGESLPGDVAFLLHDTYGFPVEVTQEMTGERNIDVDIAGFEAAMARQRALARADYDAKVGAGADVSVFQQLLDQGGPTQFVRGTECVDDAQVIYADEDSVVLDRTPFYAESGGQIGDTGSIATPTGSATVIDTVYGVPGLHRHVIGSVEGELGVGQRAEAVIDGARRDAIRRNHTGTHILHWALREVLGDHVKQQGSWVGPDRLRFDFSHYEAVTPEQIRAIEDLANAEILENPEVTHAEMTMDEARDLGAIAFFGDKYGDIVRVARAGEHSTELCGGTHVAALGDIGPLKVVSEGSIGSNLRRIEAVSGTGPIEILRNEEARLREAAELIGVPPDSLLDGISKRLNEIKALEQEVKALRQRAATGQSAELAAQAIDGVVVARVDGIDRDTLKELVMAVRQSNGVTAAVIGSALEGGGVALAAAADEDAGVNAGNLIADAAKLVKGGGGKGADFAMAGGKDPGGLDQALDTVRTVAGIG